MLEVLVSIIVVTMGLLGLAGMSIRSLASNDSSGNRANAALSAFYVADLMRGNRQQTVNGKYNVVLGANTPTVVGDPQVTANILAWKTLLQTMPEGDGSVSFDPATQLANVVVRWNDVRGNMSDTETTTFQTYTYAFRP
jgi:type IV pilus assembly protein PilV